MQDNMEPMFADNRQNNNINIEKLVSRLLDYWPSIVISVVVAMLLAFIYLRYATPQYLVKAKVLIKSEKNQAPNGALLEELGMGTGASNIENEVEIFKSRILMRRVVEDMDLNIRYYIPGSINTANLYNDAPFRVKTLYSDSAINSVAAYSLAITGSNSFEIAADDKTWKGNFGDTIILSSGKVLVAQNTIGGHLYDDVKEYKFTISPIESLVDVYLGSLSVELINRQMNIINLSITDVIPKRGEDVLAKLIEAYQQANIDDKNEIANGTISFIEDRLGLVTSELTGVEKSIENFKSTNKITDIEAQSKLLLDNTGNNVQELTQKEVQLRVLESLEKYIQDNKNTRRVMPATLIGQDVTLLSIVSEYNTLQMQRQRILLSYTENSPQIKNIDIQLEDLRLGMKNYISSLKRGYQVAVNELKAQAGFIDDNIKQVPSKERQYLEYARQQHVKQELYLFLLKKREETAISRSATVSNLKIIDPARQSGGPVSPVRSRIYLIAFVTGITLPGLRIMLKELFNNRISSKADVEANTSIPILGEIARNKDGQIIAVKKDSKTIIAEQFRALRTNIQFLLTDEKEKVILVTSSMSGEGKSFVSINLANAIALSEKKVVLLELDLRKPKIAEHLNINNQSGFSNYIIGKVALNSIIIPSGIQDNFCIVPSGPIPPNPAELLMLPKMQQMFEELKENFDYVIVDTAPIGLVTDAQLLSKYTDAVIFLLRQGYTYKQQLKSAEALYKSGKMKRMGLVVNDVKITKGSDYGYGYGTYGSGYFEDEQHTPAAKLKKMIKRKN